MDRSKLEVEKVHKLKNGKEQKFIGKKRGAVIHRSKLGGEKIQGSKNGKEQRFIG